MENLRVIKVIETKTTVVTVRGECTDEHAQTLAETAARTGEPQDDMGSSAVIESDSTDVTTFIDYALKKPRPGDKR